ncbi:MAG: SprT family zinc-dependent metalloprotease [Halarcobacter sp.]
MNFTREISNRVVEIKVLKKIRNRHTYLRVKNPLLLEISANIFFTKKDAQKLIENKIEWIEERIKNLEKKALELNEYRFLGEKYELNMSLQELDKFYRKNAQEIIPKLVEKYSLEMNLFPSSIKYRKNKNTWGSCNYKNGLNFNIYLCKFPLEIIEYVVIHELAHIKHKNHSRNFWNFVSIYCVDYKSRIKLFKSLL